MIHVLENVIKKVFSIYKDWELPGESQHGKFCKKQRQFFHRV